MRDLERSLRERMKFEDSHGPVPDDRTGTENLFGKEFDGLGPDVERHFIRWDRLPFANLLDDRVSLNLRCHHMIDGEQELQIPFFRFVKQLLREFNLVRFYQRLADLMSLCSEKCVSHSSTDDQRVDLVHQILNHANFV